MIIVIAAIFVSILFMIWLWKVPIRTTVDSLKNHGSSAFEAYFLIFFLILILGSLLYLLMQVF